MANGRCMYCGKEGVELQLIESLFAFNAADAAAFLGRDLVLPGTGSDTLTVCVEPCADVIREASDVVIRDEVYSG